MDYVRAKNGWILETPEGDIVYQENLDSLSTDEDEEPSSIKACCRSNRHLA